jgi:hypothetical protein
MGSLAKPRDGANQTNGELKSKTLLRVYIHLIDDS